MAEPNKATCQICGRTKSINSGVVGENVRPSLAEFIKTHRPAWDAREFICFDDLGVFRKDYVKHVLEDEIGELTALDQEVIESLQQHELLSENIDKQFERKLSFGERLSDRIAEFGGSWKFLILFGAVLIGWIALNAALLATRAFDPYPFILLNLILSCLAAVQAPIIMMSQNRAEVRDRLRAEYDYKINLKAELEIRHLHEKLDHLLRRQNNRLLEIQQIQIELLEELGRRRRGSTPEVVS
jgi:Predicted membrane protein